MKSKLLTFIVACSIVAAGTGVIFLATDGEPESVPSPDTNQSQPVNQEDSTTTQPKTYPILVYFSKHPESDNDPAKTFPVKRTSPDLGVANFAITQLIKGPTAPESQQGYFSTAVLRGGDGDNNFKLSINNKVARLQFLKPFDHRGSVADGQAESMIKATLLQFNTVKKVVILNSQGNCEFDLSGMNLCLQ